METSTENKICIKCGEEKDIEKNDLDGLGRGLRNALLK